MIVIRVFLFTSAQREIHIFVAYQKYVNKNSGKWLLQCCSSRLHPSCAECSQASPGCLEFSSPFDLLSASHLQASLKLLCTILPPYHSSIWNHISQNVSVPACPVNSFHCAVISCHETSPRHTIVRKLLEITFLSEWWKYTKVSCYYCYESGRRNAHAVIRNIVFESSSSQNTEISFITSAMASLRVHTTPTYKPL